MSFVDSRDDLHAAASDEGRGPDSTHPIGPVPVAESAVPVPAAGAGGMPSPQVAQQEAAWRGSSENSKWPVRCSWGPAGPWAPSTWWVVVIGGVWSGVILLTSLTGQWVGQEIVVCHLRRLTGWPCPTCGGTRMALALLWGQISEAFFFNPLLFLVVIVFGCWVVWRVVLGRELRIQTTRLGRALLWWIAGAAVFLNWLYLVVTDFGAAWR